MMIATMTLFQNIMALASVIVAASALVALWRGWIARNEGLWILAVSLAAGAAFVWPELTSALAHALGIGRGADLVLYLAVVTMIAGFWLVYLRLRRLRREITLLVRHLSLEAAERELRSSSAPTDAGESKATDGEQADS